MACRACGSEMQEKFHTEMGIHLKDLDRPLTVVFPKLLVCLHCGKAEFLDGFVIPEDELKVLVRDRCAPGR